MTKDKMPDVIWAYNRANYLKASKLKGLHRTKYLRAEPVEDLLEQMAEALEDSRSTMNYLCRPELIKTTKALQAYREWKNG